MKANIKAWLVHIGTFLIVAAIAGAMVMASGIVPIKASSGHWAITKWLLTFSMSRSVSTHSLGIEIPSNLDDSAMVMKGAGHFVAGCAPCHGSPARRVPRVTQQLTPTPPKLSEHVSKWTPANLFYITKHGIKFTGMPAFPSQQRDDEVWAVVAFLLKLPELTEENYRDLVFIDESIAPKAAPRTVVQICARCHDYDGQGRDMAGLPNLHGLPPAYLAATLRAYAQGTRHSGIMEPIAAKLDEVEFQELANYYTSRKPSRGENAMNPSPVEPEEDRDAAISRGRKIAEVGLPNKNVGACVACHSVNRNSQNGDYPFLPGQPARYLVQQLELLKDRRRGGTEFVEIMQPVAAGLTKQQQRDVAAYYASIMPTDTGE